MITRDQVADLREGDVVELRDDRWPGVVVRGPVRYVASNAYPHVGPAVIWPDSVEHIAQSITVISRAPRPLYVNHPRAIPAVGDVVRDAENDDDARTWCSDGDDGGVCWQRLDDGAGVFDSRSALPARLRLLVDGETGMAVTDQPAVDPLAHIAKGDPTPEGADENPTCGAMSRGWACTRKPGHVGQHIAGCGIGHSVAAVWS